MNDAEYVCFLYEWMSSSKGLKCAYECKSAYLCVCESIKGEHLCDIHTNGDECDDDEIEG